MTRITWPLAHTLAVLALVAVVGAGCSNGSAENSHTGTGTDTSVATDGTTGGGDSDAASSGANKSASDQDKAVKFSECIRGHGVPHFPDPDSKGNYVFGIDVSPAVWQKAVNACKDLEPPGALSAKRSPKQQSAALRFAGCMRGDGVKDFPDPVNGDPLVDTTKIPSSNQPGGMTILNAAMKQCRALLGLSAGGQGG